LMDASAKLAVPARRAIWAALAAAGVLLAGAMVRAPIFSERWDQQEEWLFLESQREFIRTLDPKEPFVRFARGDDADTAFPWFPSYLLPPGVRASAVRDLVGGR